MSRLNAILIGENEDQAKRLVKGNLNPLDVMQIIGRGYDSVVGAPTRSALKAVYEGENPLSAAADRFAQNPDTAPDFGMVGNALADPFLLSGMVAKGLKYGSQLGEMGGVIGREAMHTPSSGAEFKAALDAAVEKRPEIAKYISNYSPEEFDKFKTFLSSDKQSGFAVKPDNDLINVFSSAPRRGDEIMHDTIGKGSDHLDAFDVNDKLPKLYRRYGYNEFKREPNWTPGEPDVVYMKKGLIERQTDPENIAMKKYLRLKALDILDQQDQK